MTEQITGTRRIYEGRVVNLRIDTITLPNGKSSTREIVEHHGAVAIVPLLDDGQVVLVTQFRLAAGQNMLEVPAGGVEDGEEITFTAHRELAEEVHFQASEMTKLFQSYVAPGYSSELIHTFLATGLTPKSLKRDDDEFLDIVTIPLDEAIGLISTGGIQDSKTISALLYVKQLELKGKLP